MRGFVRRMLICLDPYAFPPDQIEIQAWPVLLSLPGLLPGTVYAWGCGEGRQHPSSSEGLANWFKLSKEQLRLVVGGLVSIGFECAFVSSALLTELLGAALKLHDPSCVSNLESAVVLGCQELISSEWLNRSPNDSHSTTRQNPREKREGNSRRHHQHRGPTAVRDAMCCGW